MSLPLLILAIIAQLPGLIGIFLPVIPGIPYMFVVALLAGFFDHFVHLSGWNLLILLLITVLSVVVDHLSGVLGAKYGGASRKAMVVGLVGTIAGMILLPPFGGLLGLFLGIAVAEGVQFKDHRRALKAASGGLLGTLAGILINTGVGLIFLICFIGLSLR